MPTGDPGLRSVVSTYLLLTGMTMISQGVSKHHIPLLVALQVYLLYLLDGLMAAIFPISCHPSGPSHFHSASRSQVRRVKEKPFPEAPLSRRESIPYSRILGGRHPQDSPSHPFKWLLLTDEDILQRSVLLTSGHLPATSLTGAGNSLGGASLSPFLASSLPD